MPAEAESVGDLTTRQMSTPLEEQHHVRQPSTSNIRSRAGQSQPPQPRSRRFHSSRRGKPSPRAAASPDKEEAPECAPSSGVATCPGAPQESPEHTRSRSPWRKRWLPKWAPDNKGSRQQPRGEPLDLCTLIRSLKQQDGNEQVCEQQQVFACVGTQWLPGVAIQSSEVHSPHQQLQVQVGGVVKQLCRRDIRVPMVPSDGDSVGEYAMPDSHSDPGLDVLITSLRADDGVCGLEEDAAVFAKVGSKWEAGLIVACIGKAEQPTYCVLVGQAVHSLLRDGLCARSGLPESSVPPSAAFEHKSADPRLLQRSLKQSDLLYQVTQDEPVYIRRQGGWLPGVVLRTCEDAEGTVLYTVFVHGRAGGVFDATRGDICPQVQVTAQDEQKKGGGLFSRFMHKRRRQRAASGTSDAAEPVALPRAEAALQGIASLQERGSKDAQNVADQEVAAAPRESPEPPQVLAAPLEARVDGALACAGVAEGLEAAGYSSDDSSAGSEWSSSSGQEHGHAQRAGAMDSEVATWDATSPRRRRQQLCQVSASLKGLLRAQQEPSIIAPRAEPVAESTTHNPDVSSNRFQQDRGSSNALPDAGRCWRPDIEHLRDVIANGGSMDGTGCEQTSFAVCVSVHNGIQSVGGEVWLPRTTVWAPANSDVVTLLCPDAVSIPWVPEDVCCTLLVELRMLGSPVTRITAEERIQQLLRESERIAWAVVPPYRKLSAASMTVNKAPQVLPMQHGPGLDPRGACMSSCQEIIASECLRLGLLTPETGELLEALDAQALPLMQVMLTLEEGSDPQPPASQVPLAPQQYASDSETTDTALEPKTTGAGVAPPQDAAGVAPPQDTAAAVVARASPEQPVLLQQMLAMARQQKALQQQSMHVQKLLQQMRDEQSMLASRLEDIGKGSAEGILVQDNTHARAAGVAPVAGSETALHANHADLIVAGEDVATRYTRLAQRDLKALQLLDHNEMHVTDDVFRGTPEQHSAAKSNQHGITRAEAALLHQSSGGASLLPSLAMPAAVALDIEEKDPLTVNNIMIQFLSLTPASSLNAPRKMQRCFMRFQFYCFRPTETPVYQLTPVQLRPAGTVRQAHCVTTALAARHKLSDLSVRLRRRPSCFGARQTAPQCSAGDGMHPNMSATAPV